jgi:hypothetical protein
MRQVYEGDGPEVRNASDLLWRGIGKDPAKYQALRSMNRHEKQTDNLLGSACLHSCFLFSLTRLLPVRTLRSSALRLQRREGCRHNGLFLKRIFDLTHNIITRANINHKGNCAPVTDHGRPYSCETSRLPYFLDSGSQMEVRSALHTGRPLPPGRFLVLISVRGWVDIKSIENSNDLNGYRTRNFPACNIVPQPTTLPRATKSITDGPNKEYLSFYYVHLKNFRSGQPKLAAVGIRCADHATPSIR